MDDIEKEAPGHGDLVVIGSSAGGVEALSVLVGTLPADFPAPIVLAQHVDPNRPSNLDAILQRRTSLQVQLVDSSSVLEAGKIYMVPSNHHVAIKDGHVEVQADRAKRPRPSVDLLLSSAAEVYGERLIAVILTGSGSDGAVGAVDVKNSGGTVIVQNPQTARYPSMPLALSPTVIDIEADLERIGPLLYDLLTGISLPQPEEKVENVLHNILEQVNRQASVDFHQYKTSTILRRISRRMTVTHKHTIRDYAQYLAAHPEEVGELVKAFLINVTQFFRDATAFAYLKSDILPKLIAQARDRDRVLRLWTAGCATGEEPYSLAMILTDLLGVELPQWSIKVFATDIDEAAISFARRGLYAENLLKDVPAEYRERFFERAEHGYHISKTLRQMVIFGQQDLSHSAPFPRIDLVLCRNVLIYFTPELQDYVLNQFAFSLGSGGYLFLGKAETVRPQQSYFELVNKQWKVYHRTSTVMPIVHRARIPNVKSIPRFEGYIFNHAMRTLGKQFADQEPEQSSLELGRFNELLLRFLPIGVVVIDHNYRILTANVAARRFLGLRDFANEQDFLHAVRGIPYTEVRTAIDTVFNEHSSVTLPEVELDISKGGNGRFIFLSLALIQTEVGTQDLAALSVADVTEQIQIKRQLEAAQVEQAQLMNELSTANKRLNDVNKELLDANEELQVTNEELMLTHEELQATIEEFETTNEELQAINEELETNNEELQATNEELETTNDELRARTGELQELSNMLENERTRLAEMVKLAPFYIMVLRGPNLLVDAFNPRYTQLFAGRLVQGQSLEEVFDFRSPSGMEIVRLAKEAYQRDTTRTTHRMVTRFSPKDNEQAEIYFVHTIVPMHNVLGKVSGVVIYSRDETEQRAQEMEEERQRLKLIFDNTDVVALALYDAQTTGLILGSPRYLDIVASVHEYDRSSLLGRQWQESTFIAPGDQAIHIWNTVIESGSSLRIPEVHCMLPPDGQETIWYCNLTPILDSEKQQTVRFILVSAVEITEQAQARREMERLNLLKDEFLSLASHELRTPLTSIMGNVQLLQRYGRRQTADRSTKEIQQLDAENSVELLDRIFYQVTRVNELIDELLDVTRIHSDQFELKNRENVNIVEVVQRVVDQQAGINDHPISLETDQESIVGTYDEGRLEQVLNNLINNAIKYSPPGKPVVVGIERQEKEAIVSVRDEGSGISEEQQAYIFDRFYRARTGENANIKGLGLGLYIAHEIVTQQGGRMWLESKVGKGSTFYFSLPLQKDEAYSH